MKRIIIPILIFALLLLLPLAIRYATYYGLPGDEEAVNPPLYEPRDILDRVAIPEASDFEDRPTAGGGQVLLDRAHENDFTAEEVAYLDSRLAARGYELLLYESGSLSRALSGASGLVIIAPQEAFSAAEGRAVQDFVSAGGRLLLMGDPTRFTVDFIDGDFASTTVINRDDFPLNSLANEFDITFRGDYLYNVSENEGNFRNIILNADDMAENSLTTAIDRLVFYGSHSLDLGPNAVPLLTVDDETRSSATDRAQPLYLAAMDATGRVLALGDLDFLSSPYYTVYDNARLVAGVADFLTSGSSDRDYRLADFPHFFEGAVNLVYAGDPSLGPDAFDEVIALQKALQPMGSELRLAAEADVAEDALYLGLYNQAEELYPILTSAQISLTIEPPLESDQGDVDESEEASETPNSDEENDVEKEVESEPAIRRIESNFGLVDMSGTAMLLLSENEGRRQLVILASSGEGLEHTVNRLLDMLNNDDEALSDCLLQYDLALCPTLIDNEPLETELVTAGIPDTTVGATEDSAVGGGESDDGSESGQNETIDALDAVLQGKIGLDDVISATLDMDISHAWTFDAGPAEVDITVVGDDEFDAVLQLYDAELELVLESDSGFSGERERLSNVEIPDDETYTIVVREFFGGTGSYQLTVSTAAAGSNSVFLFVDDDGTPLNGGVTSEEALLELFGDRFDVTIWRSSQDGPLSEDTVDGYAVVIWDSGDFQGDQAFDDDAIYVITHVLDGGNLFITGSAPSIYEDAELLNLSDVVVAETDSSLLNGLEPGTVIPLDGNYQTVQLDENGELDEDSLLLFFRGPDSDNEGGVVSAAFRDDISDGGIFVLAFPLIALPTSTQTTLVNNAIEWFDLP